MKPLPNKMVMEWKTWATPRPGLSLDQLVDIMVALGNRVLEIDRGHNRLLVAYEREEHRV